MKIVIDARMLDWTGIGRYTQRLLAELQQLDDTNKYQILLTAKGFEAWDPQAANFHKVLADIAPYSLAEQRRLAPLLRKLRPDLVHFTHLNVPLNYRGRYIVTVHDLTLVDYKNVRGSSFGKKLLYEGKFRAMKRILAQAVQRAEAIITPSDFVKQQLVQRFNLPQAKIIVTPEAAESISAQPEPYEPLLNQKFILYVGNAYPYKNLEHLVEAFGALNRPGYRLALVGKEDYFYQQLKQFVTTKHIDNVVFTAYVSDGQLAWLYRHASLFVFPSLSEGFGLPGLEAMQYGLPVVASNASSLPEVYGDAAAYFDPHNPQDIADVITKVMNDKQQRQELIEAGSERVKEFSWKRMAEQTLEVYRQASR